MLTGQEVIEGEKAPFEASLPARIDGPSDHNLVVGYKHALVNFEKIGDIP